MYNFTSKLENFQVFILKRQKKLENNQKIN
nr:MAG TPA: hypothetical protein [Caudoviricetes sp.]